MFSRYRTYQLNLQTALRHLFSGPQALAFLPAVVLAGFWLGGEVVLIVIAVGLPLCLALFGGFAPDRAGPDHDNVRAESSNGHETLIKRLETCLQETTGKSYKAACLFVELDDFEAITDRYGQTAAAGVAARSFDRLKSAMRARDQVFHLEGGRFAVAVAPVRHLDLEVAVQLAARLQSAVEEPISLDATTIYVSASAGFCLSSQIVGRSGDDLANAARLALEEARRHAPSAIRAYASNMRELKTCPTILSDEVSKALENGEIQPWYQPQISTDTGHVTGFEALARWMHPERGLIAPSEFLPALEQKSRLERLSEIMLYHALNALKSWDMQGLSVPHVGVNFAPEELCNPRLVDRIQWELDRFDLPPERLVVEILETVVATSPDDTVTRNINGLSELGCPIDLDDFGTGHASISSIRRFAIQRLKIDRSFIMKVDQDPEQQRMVSAILMMAERLDLDTLAEGVETAGEHAMLAQLGCRHVQGFGISRPLPFGKTEKWVTSHMDKLDVPSVIGRKTG